MKICDSCGKPDTCMVTLLAIDNPRNMQTKYVEESLDLCKECLENFIKDCKECAAAYRIYANRYKATHA